MLQRLFLELKQFFSLPKTFPSVKIKITMSLKEYLFSLGAGSFLCLIICFLVIMNFDPLSKPILPLIFFYLSLFLGLTGGFTFIAVLFKKITIKNEEVIFRQIKKIFKQAIIFSFLIILLLFLAHKGLLNTFNFLLILFFYFIYEGIIFSEKKSKDSFYV